MLNTLKLYNRAYLVKDSNLKLLRSSPKEWKPLTVALRQAQNYELEIQHDGGGFQEREDCDLDSGEN